MAKRLTKAQKRARARKAWKTRRKRYGKDGVMDTRADTLETLKVWQKTRSGQGRRRPATHFYMGDQVRPIFRGKKGQKQWRRTVVVDIRRPGTAYEVWERVRVKRKGFPKGLDRWQNEWAHLHDKPPKAGKVKMLRKVS